jgi:hypothetical protein
MEYMHNNKFQIMLESKVRESERERENKLLKDNHSNYLS